MLETNKQFQEFWQIVVDVWKNGLYGIDVGQILVALCVFMLAAAVRGAFTRLVLHRIEAWTQNTDTEIDDILVGALTPPLRFIPLVVGIFFATAILDFTDTAATFVSNLNRSLIAFTIFWSFYRCSEAIGLLLNRAERVLTSTMIDWLARFIRMAFVILGGATILEIWGIEVGPLIAGLGLFGVAIALGAQDLFKNLIAGLFVIGEKRFHPGDWILIEGVVEGTVEYIGFRTTAVRRFDKAPVYVPNSILSDQSVTNFSRMTYRRIKWVIGVRYDATASQLETIRDGIARYLDNTQDFARPADTTTFIRIDSFNASSIDLLLYCFTNTTNWLEWLEIKEKLLLEIKRIVEDAGTSFAFPSQSLYIEAMGADYETVPKSK